MKNKGSIMDLTQLIDQNNSQKRFNNESIFDENKNQLLSRS